MTEIQSINPRTGVRVDARVSESPIEAIDEALTLASQAAPRVCAATSEERISWLRSVAHSLDVRRDELIALADDETALGESRLSGEIDRTRSQIQLFIDVLADGGYRDIIIDLSDPDSQPAPRADIRRMKQPLGPVAVWAASNFPFAFGIMGGDTASALAAGCPVIVKAHPSQPALSARIGEVVQEGLSSADAPIGSFAVLHGMAAGDMLIRDQRIQAAGFTGSVRGGRALFDLACARPRPIPFFGELGSINPVIVTPAAAAARGESIARGLVASATQGVGQFCTKPGLILVPRGSGLLRAASAAMTEVPAGAMLNAAMRDAYAAGVREFAGMSDVSVVAVGEANDGSGSWATPTLVCTTVSTLKAHMEALAEECFGPVTVIVEYDDVEQVMEVASVIPGSLTATIHGESESDQDLGIRLRTICERFAGRLIWNGWPTGVAVTWSMQHGGPYPSSTASASTSVGASAIERWLRPVAYQGFPEALLPSQLTNDGLQGAARIDGRLRVIG